MSDSYNGWKNWETWNTNYWLTQDQESQKALDQMLSPEAIQESVEYNLLEEEPAGLKKDLLTASLSMVDWREIFEANKEVVR